MPELKEQAIRSGWLRGGERLLAERLAFPLERDLPEVVFEANRSVRDRVLADVLGGVAKSIRVTSCLGDEEEIAVAEVERYGLPLRTVLSRRSGLMRSDPYYDPTYLGRFYRDHYRGLYRPKRFSMSWFFSEEVRHGQRIMERLPEKFGAGARVLDVGCGMGGALVAFAMEGCEVVGFDYGEDYAAKGRRLGLDVRVGGFESVANERPFDLIMMSHVIEHVADPVAFARDAAKVLAPQGWSYVEVPGIFNICAGYEGDLLTYLQNAHQWHFTAATLRAVLARAGLHVERGDESIWCLARRGSIDVSARACDGERVEAQIVELERNFAGAKKLVEV